MVTVATYYPYKSITLKTKNRVGYIYYYKLVLLPKQKSRQNKDK